MSFIAEEISVMLPRSICVSIFQAKNNLKDIPFSKGGALLVCVPGADKRDHVGSKTKAECISHFNYSYMQSPCFPLLDLSHTIGKSKEELLAISREHAVKTEMKHQGRKMHNDVILFMEANIRNQGREQI